MCMCMCVFARVCVLKSWHSSEGCVILSRRTPQTEPKPHNSEWNGKQQEFSLLTVQWPDNMYFLKCIQINREPLQLVAKSSLQPLPWSQPASPMQTPHAASHAFGTPRSRLRTSAWTTRQEARRQLRGISHQHCWDPKGGSGISPQFVFVCLLACSEKLQGGNETILFKMLLDLSNSSLSLRHDSRSKHLRSMRLCLQCTHTVYKGRHLRTNRF